MLRPELSDLWNRFANPTSGAIAPVTVAERKHLNYYGRVWVTCVSYMNALTEVRRAVEIAYTKILLKYQLKNVQFRTSIAVIESWQLMMERLNDIRKPTTFDECMGKRSDFDFVNTFQFKHDVVVQLVKERGENALHTIY